MKTIGLVGGIGWVSSVEYYRIINEAINQRLGELNSARCILYSINFAEIDELKKKDDSAGQISLLRDAAKKVLQCGADCILLCANTAHQFADQVAAKINVPLIHIAEATADEILKKKILKVGLLGTKQTMELDFYNSRLKRRNIEVMVPEKDDREFIHSTIWNELLLEVFSPQSKRRFLKIIRQLQLKGAEAVILGCTEIPLLIKQEDTDLLLFDTLKIHAHAAVDFAASHSDNNAFNYPHPFRRKNPYR